MNSRNALIASITAIALASGLSACAPVQTTENSGTPVAIAPTNSASSQIVPSAAPSFPVPSTGLTSATQMAEQLTYLIEEEKLAHDVYTKLFEVWGARVFGNILQSENSHQSQVLSVLVENEIKDPRFSTIGDFHNKELQALYDQLITKGLKSEVDAYQVGVAIEELDIKDLTDMLSTATDSAAISMMETLRRGSENHLRAFNRQL